LEDNGKQNALFSVFPEFCVFSHAVRLSKKMPDKFAVWINSVEYQSRWTEVVHRRFIASPNVYPAP